MNRTVYVAWRKQAQQNDFEGPFCLSCTRKSRNEGHWVKKSARVSEKLVSPGLPGLQVATRLIVDISVLFALLQQRYTTRNRFSQLRFFPFGSLNKSNYKFRSTWFKLHRFPCNFTAVAAVIILFNMVQRQRWTGGALTCSARESRFTWRKTTPHILHNSFRQSQTITLDRGFLFPHAPCPMLFCRFKNISKEKSTSL